MNIDIWKVVKYNNVESVPRMPGLEISAMFKIRSWKAQIILEDFKNRSTKHVGIICWHYGSISLRQRKCFLN